MQLVVIVVAIGLSGILAAAASASCNPGRSSSSGNWHDGWYRDAPSGTCVIGTLANIYVYSPYVASADVTAWSMIANGVTGSYGQVGWLQQTSNRYNFTESSTAGGGFQQRLLSASTLGSSPAYKVTYGSGTFSYYVNGSLVDTDSAPGFGGCQAQIFGEVTNLANQMPGGYNNHELFTSSQFERSDTGTWFYLDGATSTERADLFGNSKVSSTEAHIWDKSCAS